MQRFSDNRILTKKMVSDKAELFKSQQREFNKPSSLSRKKNSLNNAYKKHSEKMHHVFMSKD